MYLFAFIRDVRELSIINWKLNLIYKQTYVQYTLIYNLSYTGPSSYFFLSCRLLHLTTFLVLNSKKLIKARTN